MTGAEEVLPIAHGHNATDGAGIIAMTLVSDFGSYQRLNQRTYPNRTPPKATKKPIAMAGHDAPT